jgi:cyclophilin family peptidyl-prolyl cis-trans isomerase
MKKLLFLFVCALILAGCSAPKDKAGVLDEKNAPYNPNNNDAEIMSKIIDIKNGAKPMTKPTGKSQAQTPEGQPPVPTPESMPQKMELADLAKEFKFAVLKTSLGDIKVGFYPEESPVTVNNFLNLAQKGFYNGTKFHRVIKDFMIQGGDPLSADDTAINRWGTGGPGYKFQDEINEKKLVKGSLAMANSGPNTNGSQFFIVTKESTPWLDGKHTNFGYVVEGMDVVMKIDGTAVDQNDRPLENVVIQSVELLK